MTASTNASINRTLAQRGLVAQWVYTWILFAYWAQFLERAACSSVLGVPSPLSRSTSGTVEYSTREVVNRPEVSAPWDHARLWNVFAGIKRESALDTVYASLLTLRENFSAGARMANHGSQAAEAIYDGQEVVVGFLPAAVQLENELSRGDNPNPERRSIVPDGQSVTMMSAATGMTGQYTFMRDHASWILRGPNGERYQFRLWALDSGKEQDGFGSLRALEAAEETMNLQAVFGLPSLSDVEREFHVPVFRDILTHPSGQPDLSFPAGRVLNFITLWKPTVINLQSFARATELYCSAFPEMKEAAIIARYNLTLQVIGLVGHITRRGVILGRFNLSGFRLDESGTVDFVPDESPRRAEGPVPEWVLNAGLPAYSTLENAKDLGFAVFYLWCPLEAQEILGRKQFDEILTRASRCPYMSEDVRHILHSIFTENKDTDDVLDSSAFRNLDLRLRQASEQRVVRLTQKT